MPDLQSQSSQQPQFNQEGKSEAEMKETQSPLSQQLLTYAEAHPVDEAIKEMERHSDQEEECQVAEKRVHELLHIEKEIKNRVHDLEEDQTREILEFEMKQREINANLESARTNLKNLKYKYEQDRNELDEKKIRLQKLRNQTKMVQELADRHQKEHAELEKYIQEIGEKARKNSDTANHLLGEYRKLQNEIIEQSEQLAREEADIEEDEYIVSKREEQRELIESCGNEKLEDEELTCWKAEILAREIQEERREAQHDVSRLIAEKQAAELGDTSQTSQEKSLGTKILDTVTNIF